MSMYCLMLMGAQWSVGMCTQGAPNELTEGCPTEENLGKGTGTSVVLQSLTFCTF